MMTDAIGCCRSLPRCLCFCSGALKSSIPPATRAPALQRARRNTDDPIIRSSRRRIWPGSRASSSSLPASADVSFGAGGDLPRAAGVRYWVIGTLGRFWTHRIITLDTETVVRRGPTSHIRHPNYAVTIAETFLLPAVFGAMAPGDHHGRHLDRGPRLQDRARGSGTCGPASGIISARGLMPWTRFPQVGDLQEPPSR